MNVLDFDEIRTRDLWVMTPNWIEELQGPSMSITAKVLILLGRKLDSLTASQTTLIRNPQNNI
jgi:GTPase SAR1 family protein